MLGMGKASLHVLILRSTDSTGYSLHVLSPSSPNRPKLAQKTAKTEKNGPIFDRKWSKIGLETKVVNKKTADMLNYSNLFYSL